MKKKILVIFIALLSAIACAFGLAACNKQASDGNNGTYYLYEYNKLDKSQYIKLDGDKWSDDDNTSGTFTLNGETIVFYAQVFGSNEEMYSGTLSNGALKIKFMGATMTYYKEGSEPSNSGGSPNTGEDTPNGHTHNWAKTLSSNDEYHWYSCSGCSEKKDNVKHYYVDGECVCGKTEPQAKPNEPVKKEYDVTFNLNYVGATTVTKTTEDKLITFIPTRSDYEFSGWYLDSELMRLFDTTKPVTDDGLVLYAAWVEAATEVGQLSAPVLSVEGNTFSWKQVTGATGYRIVVTLSGSKEDVIDETSRSTSWNFPQRLEAGIYSVKIRALGDGIVSVNSVYSSRNYSLRVLGSVSGIALNRATSLLSWNEVENAEEYHVYVGNKLVSDQSETTFDLSNYNAGTLDIKITATKTDWLTATGSAKISKMRLKTPEVKVTANVETRAYVLKWDSVLYADTYILKYGEKEIKIKETNYTISKDSAIWNGQNMTTFTVDAFDSKTEYIISSGAKEITINKIYNLNIDKSIEGAGSTSVKGKIWGPITVSFDLNGASGYIRRQTVTTKQGLTYPEIPTRSGYIFRGWFTEKSCENLYDFTSTIESSITLYAGWQSYSGTFVELNSGRQSVSSGTSNKFIYFRALSDSQIRIGYNQTSSSTTSYMMIYDVTKREEWSEEQSFKNTSPSTTYFYPTAGHVYYIRLRSSSSTTISLSLTTYPSDTYLPNDGGVAIADTAITDFSSTASSFAMNGEEYTITSLLTYKGYTWVGWYDGDKELTKELRYTFTMPAKDVNYTAKWIKVNTESSSTSAGTVTTLDETYKVGDEVTVTASTNSGYTWVGWYNGDKELTKELNYTFKMPAESATYTAKWIKVDLTRNSTYAGSITSLSETYKVGDEVTVTAATNNGYTWVGWYNGDTELSKELSYTFKMPAGSATYTAKWIKVSLARSSTYAGSITSLSETYKVGDEVTVTATTNDGYTFVGWYNGETELSKELSYTFKMPAEDATYTATWTYYTLTTSRNNSSAGIVTSFNNTKVTAGNEVTITATTNNGYTFVGWYNGEIELSKELSYTFTMPAENVAYTATWTYYTLTTSRNNSSAGTVTSYNNTRVTAGDEVTITAITNNGYSWVGWYDGETVLSKELSYTFAMPIENITYTAKWSKVTIASSTTGAGIVSELNETYLAGDEVTVIATTNKGYNWLGWYNGEIELTKESSYTFTIPIENATYTAKWEVWEELSIFNFTSTMDKITVTGIKDSNATEIIVPDCVDSIGEKAFYFCGGLTSVTITDSVTSIGSSAFFGCSKLTRITIPDSVTSIGDRAFEWCDGLTIYCVASSRPSGWSGSWCSSNCSVVWDCKNNEVASDGYIYIIIDGIRYGLIDDRAVVVRQTKTVSGEIVIPSSITYKEINYSVTGIVYNAFKGCNLSSIFIPNSVTGISDKAFENCNCLIYCEATSKPSGWGKYWNIYYWNGWVDAPYYGPMSDARYCTVVWGYKPEN